MDYATGFVQIEHLINFTGSETIQAKQCFEKKMMDIGIVVHTYQSDNGIFALADFMAEINKGLQNISFSGVRPLLERAKDKLCSSLSSKQVAN